MFNFTQKWTLNMKENGVKYYFGKKFVKEKLNQS